tara:strand:- start:1873 stop:3306 length:1434 start_codon:yes stop_codon:yes gene_type:complete
MELTNYSAIDIRGQFLTAEPEYARTLERLGTGKRVIRSSDDPGVTAISMKKHSDLTRNHSIRTGIQNAISYAQMQYQGLKQVGEVYHRMGQLAQSSLDIMKNNDDRGLLDKEFNELVERLLKIRDDKFNGVALFDPLVSCDGGAPVDFSDGLNEQMPADYTSGPEVVDPSGKTWNKMWESAADVHATDGRLTLKVNGGSAAERFVVRQGDTVIFDTGEWRSRGNAYQYDFDQFVVEFGNGKTTTYSYTELDTGGQFGVADPSTNGKRSNPAGTPSNPDPNGTLDNSAANFGDGGTSQTGVVQTFDAPGDSTVLKIQIYSDTLFQAEAVFEPIVVNNDQIVLTDVRGETMTIDSLGFGTMAGFGVKTVADAQSTLEKLYGKTGDGTQEGEVHCLWTEQHSKAVAHISRLNSAIEKLRVNQVSEERVLSTIEDLDFASESTNLARHTIKLDVLNRLLATAVKMTDVLMPLATQRSGSTS